MQNYHIVRSERASGTREYLSFLGQIYTWHRGPQHAVAYDALSARTAVFNLRTTSTRYTFRTVPAVK